MTSYAELVSDSYLLQQVGDAKSVTIFGCPYCASRSIAIAKNISVIGKSSLGGISYTPFAVSEEANRLKELLESKDIVANVKIFGALASNPFCWMTRKGLSKVAKACENSDVAIALFCGLGREGIKSALQGSFKVVPGMVAVGQISAYIINQKGKIILDREKTKVFRFQEVTQLTYNDLEKSSTFSILFLPSTQLMVN